MKRQTLFTFASALLCAGTIAAQNYKGVDAILKELAAKADQAPAEKKTPDAASSLLAEIKSYRQQAKTLTPEQAASKWLALYDAYALMPASARYSRGGSSEQLSLQALIESLPPTSAWQELTTQVQKRGADTKDMPTTALRLLIAVLNGDGGERKKAMDAVRAALKAKPGMDDYMKEHLEDYLLQLSDLLIARTGSPEEKLAKFEEALSAFESKDERKMDRFSSLDVPELAKIVGREKTEAYLLRVLKLGREFNVEGEETRRLASAFVLANINEVSKPIWSLVRDQEDIKLFEALLAKFGDEGKGQPERDTAETVYLISLIINNRTEEASKFMLELITALDDDSLSFGDLAELQRKGYSKQLLAFMRNMLEKDPSLPLWPEFIELSAQQSDSPEALKFLNATLAKPDLTPRARQIVEPHFYQALLAADQVDEGIKILQKLASAGPQRAGGAAIDELKEKFEKLGLPAEEALQADQAAQENAFSTHQELCLKLARLGGLLKRPELITEGLQQALAQHTKLNHKETTQQSCPTDLVELLVKNGRGVEAEDLLAKRLAANIEQQKAERESYYSGVGPYELTALAWIYSQADRQAEVIQLLDDAPYWGAHDLLHVSGAVMDRTSLNELAAEAFIKMDRKREATAIVDLLIEKSPGQDAGYELLLKLEGAQAMAKIDAQVKSDVFQERPLIWKAKLQFDAGDLEAAEKSIRAAIAIDPSDGEQGKGDRMRAYAVLGDILEKKGDMDHAKIMRGAVTAIRLSEDADDWWAAGLLTRAVKMYEKSLLHFADAYCIQSRLALRYSELGEFDKAEQHYRRAYELMPGSFGRIESHCFGCEGAFRGERAQGVAERVFTKLAEEQPNKAQVFYLLGYLRESQDRPQEAADNYRKAIKLDPDYLNALKKLGQLADRVNIPAEERDTITLELFRLDPFGRHGGAAQLNSLSDLRRLWDVILNSQDRFPDEAGAVEAYPLAASRAALLKQRPDMDPTEYFGSRGQSPRATLLSQFSRHDLVTASTQMLEMLLRQN